MNYSAASFAMLALPCSVALAQPDPLLDLWVYNSSGRVGSGNTVCIDNQVNAILADVTRLRFTAADVYVNAESIPGYTIGDWNPPSGMPPFINVPQAQCHLRRIPRSPVEAVMQEDVGLGPIGIWVNGVAVFSAADGNSPTGWPDWHQNACVLEVDNFDDAMGHPTENNPAIECPPEGPCCRPAGPACPTVLSGIYHHHCSPIGLRAQLGDDGGCHSPLLGFAFDGFPIYGPYAYSDPDDAMSVVVRMRSGYDLRHMRTGGPSEVDYPLGSFIEDFDFVGGPGRLDRHNGRHCVTPEFPAGTYAYFTTLDASANPEYPYIIGPQYKGVVIDDNIYPNPPATVPADAEEYTPIHELPCPTICRGPTDRRACRRGTATFDVRVRYGTAVTYRWLKDGVPLTDGPTGTGSVIAGATTRTLLLTDVFRIDEGQYACRVNGDCGVITSNSASLAVCAPDINCDGMVTSQDFFDFLACFFAPSPPPCSHRDFNRDGIANSQDFFDFIAAFFAGCP
ncbi:MAG: YHYH protein [Phycisphaerales bacterium]